MLRACWAARTSVGASRAACPPESMTRSIARSATTVLPEPTSPCRSRCIGWLLAISSSITAATSRCPPVSVNGSPASNSSRRPPARPGLGIAGAAVIAARRWASTTCTPNASSHRSRSIARRAWLRSTGRWTHCRAVGRSSTPTRARRSSSRGSGQVAASGRARRTLRAMVQLLTFCVAG